MASKSYSAAFVTLFLAVVATGASAADPPVVEKNPPAAANGKTPAPNRVLVTISKETTFIIKPLRKDGYPDYVAALNEICGKGATSDNNATVLLWNALGPEPIKNEYRAEYFRMLGMPVPAEKGSCFIERDEFIRQRHSKDASVDPGQLAAEGTKFDDQLYRASKKQWPKTEFPDLAAWLAANKKPLDLAVEASRRARYFEPLVSATEPPLIAALGPSPNSVRQVGSALTARATQHLNEGKTDAAWQDLLAVHRLARLCGHGPMLTDALLATSMDRMACNADLVLLRNSPLSAADALQMRQESAKLHALPKMADCIDRGERFMFLDSVAFVARNGPASVGKLGNADRSIVNSIAGEPIDWNVSLRMGNSLYDRTVEALRKPAVADQRAALELINKDIDGLMRREKNLTLSSLLNPRGAISARFGAIFVAMYYPAAIRIADVEHSAETRFDLTKLAFSLAAYRADHRSYPAKLDELVPKYAGEVPKDIFAAADLHFNRDGNGYLLYSVGPNGQDDGGKGLDDCKNGEDWDDIVVRMRSSP